MQADNRKDYEISGSSFCQLELTPFRLQRLAATEAWAALQGSETGVIEVQMNPEQCAQFFNAVLIPVVNGQPQVEQIPGFTADDFKTITIRQVGEVLSGFCFFNPELMLQLTAFSGLSHVLAENLALARAGADQNTGNTSAMQPAAATLPN